MITAPPKIIEWKLDRTPRGGVLKRACPNGRLETKGAAYFDDRFSVFVIRKAELYTEAEELEVALEILWSWRTGSTRDHHALCGCDDCEMRRSRHPRFRYDEEEDDQ